jgi:hypothetical protein
MTDYYEVTIDVRGTVKLTVEANSEEEALESVRTLGYDMGDFTEDEFEPQYATLVEDIPL